MIIYGRNVVKEAILSTHTVSKVYVQQSIHSDKKISEILLEANNQNVTVEKHDNSSLTRIAKNKHHQGIAAEISIRTFSSLVSFLKDSSEYIHNSFMFILESQLSQNLGAIARSAEVAGMRGIIIPPKQQITPESIKISTGGLLKIPIIKDSAFNAIKTAKNQGYIVAGIERGGETYYQANISLPTLFIIGGEDKELTSTIQGKCDTILTIPQFGDINSLNMSVAAGIIMFEHIKQLHN